MRQVDSPNSSSSTPKRNLLRAILGGILFIGVPAGAQAYYSCAEISDASAVKSQNEKLMSVRAFLEENRTKLRAYSGLSPEAMARQADVINTLLLNLIDEMKKAKSAADEIAKTGVRFNPVMFEELEITLDLAIRELGPESGKINSLNEAADKMHKSKEGWGIFNSAARNKGINPDAVMYMSFLIPQLRQVLAELQSAVVALEEEDIDGCSSNSFVDRTISEKLGANHCRMSNSLFCKATKVRTETGELDSSKLSKMQAMAVQRQLIIFELLGENENSGKFGESSQRAFTEAEKSKEFNAMIEECKK
jgi:hypothetical protein